MEERKSRVESRLLTSHGILVFAALLPLFCLLITIDHNSRSVAEAGEEPGELAAYDSRITASDREYWAFQPLKSSPVPVVRHTDWPRNALDNFVLAKLEEKGWQPSPAAEPRALLRRAYFDLVGLPPTPEEQDAFLADASPHAYEKVVDRLLADPGYGERWGRHWLDLVRYAETNGYERDAIKPHAWRYRDYVIDALNADKPYDRFAVEQIAGDELPDATTETILATGFNRLGPWDDEPADPVQDRSDQLDDVVRTTSEAFLGLTVGCARCHNHKFDPLTMHDYYRMVAVFDTLQRSQNGRTELDLPAGTREQLAKIAERDKRITDLQKRVEELRGAFRAEFLAAGRSKLSAEVVAAFAAAPDKRTPAQHETIKSHESQLGAELAAALPEAARSEIESAEREIARCRREIPDLPRGYFLHEPSPTLPKTALLLRGRATAPGPLVQPGVPAVLVPAQPKFMGPDVRTSRSRLSMARWIVSADNPIAARVIVNRVWQFHFGEGIVRSPSDFGIMGQSPTHPELLDWLAHWFTHEGSWSLKRLHRLIVTSSSYQMSKRWNGEYGAADPENRLLWRFPYRRLEVEAIRDAMLSASGVLNRQMHGESVYLSVPKAALEGHSDPGQIWKAFDEQGAARRTAYAFIKRSLVVPMLEVLDLCDSTRSAEKRVVTSVPTQALTLFNGDETNRQAAHLARRLHHDVGDDPARQIDRAYRLALCRTPTDSELAAMRQYLQAEEEKLHNETANETQPRPADWHRDEALVRLCRVIFNLNEFVYTD